VKRAGDVNARLRDIPAPGRIDSTVTARRAAIVEACIQELHNHGFSRMTVESVARRAGIDKRTLYDYIGRKEDLLLLVFAQYLPQVLDTVREARDASIDPADQLAGMLRAHTEILSGDPDFVLFLYRELHYLPRDDQESVLRLMDDIHLEYTRVFTILAKQRDDLPTSDAVLNASSALTMMDMIGLHRHHLSTRSPYEIAEHIYRTLLGECARRQPSTGP
jgi:AcrR family transcriptional regulator